MPRADLLTARRPPGLPGRRRPGPRRLLSALLAALVVAGTGYVALGHRADTGQPVLVATGHVPVGATLTAADLEIRQIPEPAVPEGALTSSEQAVGRPAAAVLSPGEVLTGHDVRTGSLLAGQDPGDVALWLPLPEPQVAAALAAGDLVDVLSPVDGSPVLSAVPVLAAPGAGGDRGAGGAATGLAAVAAGAGPAGGRASGSGGVWLAVPAQRAGALAAAQGADPAGTGLLVAVHPPTGR